MKKSHWGSWSLSLCPHNYAQRPEQDSCFEQFKLELKVGGLDYVINSDDEGLFYNTTAKLPAGLTCTQCVLRWHYKTGV